MASASSAFASSRKRAGEDAHASRTVRRSSAVPNGSAVAITGGRAGRARVSGLDVGFGADILGRRIELDRLDIGPVAIGVIAPGLSRLISVEQGGLCQLSL